ncbi:hypothetical protein PG995_000256 [Apiospora arundinis]
MGCDVSICSVTLRDATGVSSPTTLSSGPLVACFGINRFFGQRKGLIKKVRVLRCFRKSRKSKWPLPRKRRGRRQPRRRAPVQEESEEDDDDDDNQMQQFQQQQMMQQQQQQQQQMQQQQGGGGGGKSDTLKLRLDLNLEVEVTLKARIHGDLTLALLDGA